MILFAKHNCQHIDNDRRLDEFSDENAECDVLNQCHKAGWLKSTHDDTDSFVTLTYAGRAALASQQEQS